LYGKSRKQLHGLPNEASLRQGLYYFTVGDLAAILKVTRRKAYEAAARLEGRGLVRRVERGKYVVMGYEPARILANPFFVASHAVRPSYVSFWSALSHYGSPSRRPGRSSSPRSTGRGR